MPSKQKELRAGEKLLSAMQRAYVEDLSAQALGEQQGGVWFFLQVHKTRSQTMWLGDTTQACFASLVNAGASLMNGTSNGVMKLYMFLRLSMIKHIMPQKVFHFGKLN